jgi:endonuclease YncB( thermonuclease family)
MEKAAVIAWDAGTPARRLAWRRRRVWAGWAIVLCIGGSIVVDHVIGARRGGDDWAQFDGRQVPVVSADDAQTISVRGDGADQQITQVRVLGIGASDGDWTERCREFLASSLAGRMVTLKLEPTQTRDGRDRLLASVFLEDGRPISVDVVERGLARADRSQAYAFSNAVVAAQSEARKKHRGVWEGY